MGSCFFPGDKSVKLLTDLVFTELDGLGRFGNIFTAADGEIRPAAAVAVNDGRDFFDDLARMKSFLNHIRAGRNDDRDLIFGPRG